MKLVIGNVDSIQQDSAFTWCVEARKEAEHCCLTGARRPNDSDDLSWFHLQRDIVQRVPASFVAETQVLIFHSSPDEGDLPSVRCVAYLGVGIEYLKCALKIDDVLLQVTDCRADLF